MGNMNADISDAKSLFGRHLTQYCHDNKLILSSRVLLPASSFTYVSEAWNTTSWLDHVICTADAHDCVEQMEIMYGLAATDHMPVSIMLKVANVPELISKDSNKQAFKLQWAKLSDDDLRSYHDNTDKNLEDIGLPYDAILCDNINCNNSKHSEELCIMYETIIKGLNKSSTVFSQKRGNLYKPRPGWNEHVVGLHQQARETFRTWVNAGKPRHGPECDSKKQAMARFKSAVRYIKRNELTLRANAMARKLQQKDVLDFWKEVKIINNSKIPLPSNIDGVTGSANIAELWKKHYKDLFNCVKSDDFSVGAVSYDNVAIRPDEVRTAIEKLALNKFCGPDQSAAEHLRYSSHRASVLLAYVFLEC